MLPVPVPADPVGVVADAACVVYRKIEILHLTKYFLIYFNKNKIIKIRTDEVWASQLLIMTIATTRSDKQRTDFMVTLERNVPCVLETMGFLV